MSADDETTAPDGQTADEPDAAKASAAKKPAAAKKAPAEKKPAASAEKKAAAEKKPAAEKKAAAEKAPAAAKKPAAEKKAAAEKKPTAEDQPAADSDAAAAEQGSGKPQAAGRSATKKKIAKKAASAEAAAPGDAAEAQELAKAKATAKPAEKVARRAAAGVKQTPRRRVVAAHARYVRTSARKARMVCGHLRGKSVQEARAILAFTPREVARDWAKLLESAVANAESNHELLEDDLIVREAYADEGPTIKRFRPRAMGRATPIRKRTSHLTITLTARPEPATNKRNR
jgi:ribosomal protein L22